jgi:hypothetical protein
MQSDANPFDDSEATVHAVTDGASRERGAAAVVGPPLAPEIEREWRAILHWWEQQLGGTVSINAPLPLLTAARGLLERLAPSCPRTPFWEQLPESDWQAALLAAMAQLRTMNPISHAYEPNRRILPPLALCLKILNSNAQTHVKELVYMVLQKGEYPLNTARREELQRHFDEALSSPDAPAVAFQTAARLNFKDSKGNVPSF